MEVRTEVVEAGAAHVGREGDDGGVDDEADERQVGGPGRDRQLDYRHER